jgi:hypothetical protein
MPHRDFLPQPPRIDALGRLHMPDYAAAALALALQRLNRGRNKPKGRDADRGGVPVEPNRPNTLSGGAAAPLEFDQD